MDASTDGSGLVMSYSLPHMIDEHNTARAHAIVRNVLARDVSSAVEGLQLLAGADNPLPVFGWWLVSGNQRWWKPKPRLVTFRRAS